MSVLYTASCRARQVLIRLGRRFRPAREQLFEEGPGSMYTIGQLLRSNRLENPLLVVGADAQRWLEPMRQTLEDSDVAFSAFAALPDAPTERDADSVFLQWQRSGCDSFIALGGPETISLVKAAAARAASPGTTLSEFAGYRKLRRRPVPVVAVPTTGGSGAEASAFAWIRDDDGVLFSLEDPRLVPPLAVYDPSLSADTPRPALAEAVMSGLCLATEAYLSRYADDGARAAAAESVRAFLEAAAPCWDNGGTILQRSRLMEASRLAGSASAAGTGYACAIIEAVAAASKRGVYEICGAALPAVLEKYGNAAIPALAKLSDAAGVGAGGTKAQRAADLIARFRHLAFCMGLPDGIEPLGSDDTQLAANLSAHLANPHRAAPVVWTEADCGSVIRSLYLKEITPERK